VSANESPRSATGADEKNWLVGRLQDRTPESMNASRVRETDSVVPPTTVISLKGRLHDWGRSLEHAPADVVYVGRECKRRFETSWVLAESPLNNPHHVGRRCKTCGEPHTREQAVGLYIGHLNRRPDLFALLSPLRGKRLACWCAPELCHAHILAKLLNREGL
jgi:hypothetical protein